MLLSFHFVPCKIFDLRSFTPHPTPYFEDIKHGASRTKILLPKYTTKCFPEKKGRHPDDFGLRLSEELSDAENISRVESVTHIVERFMITSGQAILGGISALVIIQLASGKKRSLTNSEYIVFLTYNSIYSWFYNTGTAAPGWS